VGVATRERFAEVVRRDPVDVGLACALIAAVADPAVDPAGSLLALDALAGASRATVAAAPTPAEGLRVALGVQAGFSGYAEDSAELRASLLPDVVERRRGLPVLLSVVWVEVARRLGLDAGCIGLPGHVIATVAGELCDPWYGGRLLTGHDAADRVRASGLAFSARMLTPMSPGDLLTRVLANIRHLDARTLAPINALWATELTLLLPRHPLGLRREHGDLLVRTGQYDAGARQLETYADAIEVAEPTVARAARDAARMSRARLS